MSPLPVAATTRTRGCTVVLRRVEGPEASELFFLCQPPAEATDAAQQAEAAYHAIVDVLEAEGGSFASVVSETLFLRSVRADLAPIRAARSRVLAARAGPVHRPATAEIEQPPLNEGACLEVAVQALLPKQASLRVETLETRPACGCAECARTHGVTVGLGEEARLYVGSLYGRGADAYEQTLAMFGVAEALLRQAGMEFRDVTRTWIHLREMERDYAELNRGRRAFFESRGIDPVPASTGIGGGPVPAEHDLCLGIYAVKSAPLSVAPSVAPAAARSEAPHVRTVMTAPTLNEAPQYGADFARGMKVIEANRVALHVSGTASVDEAGRTAHPGDFEAQADRMLVNVAALLEGQGATFGDVVSAVTYLKHPADADKLRAKLHEARYEGFPNVLVAAPICRPELLCETEALAVLPGVEAPHRGWA